MPQVGPSWIALGAASFSVGSSMMQSAPMERTLGSSITSSSVVSSSCVVVEGAVSWEG